MLAATVKMSDSRKKVNKNTYVHFLHKTCSQDVSGSFSLQSCKISAKKCTKKVRCTCKVAFLLIRHIVVFSPFSLPSPLKHRGGSRIFFRRGCTRLLLYFNSNKPHSFFLAEYQLYQKTAGHLRGWGGSHPLHPPPRSAPVAFRDCLSKLKSYRELCVQPWLNLCINIYIYTVIQGKVNSHGYFEQRKPIKTRKNCFQLIWLILIINLVMRVAGLIGFHFRLRSKDEFLAARKI